MLNRNIILSQKTRVKGILLIKDHEAFTTSFKRVVYINLSLKKRYIAQQAKRAYLAFIYQFKHHLIFFILLNKQSFF